MWIFQKSKVDRRTTFRFLIKEQISMLYIWIFNKRKNIKGRFDDVIRRNADVNATKIECGILSRLHYAMLLENLFQRVRLPGLNR